MQIKKNKEIYYYYLLYGFKGIMFYGVLFSIKQSSISGIGLFFGAYSLFLTLVPLCSLGIPSYAMRFSYSKRLRSSGFLILMVFSAILLLFSALVFNFDIKVSLILIWVLLRNILVFTEVSLVALRNYMSVSLLYLAQGGLLCGIIILAMLGIINNFYALIILFFVVEAVSLFWLKRINIKLVPLLFLANKKILLRIFKYSIPVMFTGFLIAYFINLDRLFIARYLDLAVLENYGLIAIFMLATHRFVTGPIIMRYSVPYYSAKNDNISRLLILKMIFLHFIAAIFLYLMFDLTNLIDVSLLELYSFYLFVLNLFLLNCYMLYFKKRKELFSQVMRLVVVLFCGSIMYYYGLLFYGEIYLPQMLIGLAFISFLFLGFKNPAIKGFDKVALMVLYFPAIAWSYL